MRPSSILWFERLYLAAIVIGIVNSAMSWGSFAQTQETLGIGFVIGTLVVSVGINLALWYFVARRRSVVAKWVLVALFALGLASLGLAFIMGTYPGGIVGATGAVGWLLQVAAIVFLFRSDASAWFAGADDPAVGRPFE